MKWKGRRQSQNFKPEKSGKALAEELGRRQRNRVFREGEEGDRATDRANLENTYSPFSPRYVRLSKKAKGYEELKHLPFHTLKKKRRYHG